MYAMLWKYIIYIEAHDIEDLSPIMSAIFKYLLILLLCMGRIQVGSGLNFLEKKIYRETSNRWKNFF